MPSTNHGKPCHTSRHAIASCGSLWASHGTHERLLGQPVVAHGQAMAHTKACRGQTMAHTLHMPSAYHGIYEGMLGQALAHIKACYGTPRQVTASGGTHQDMPCQAVAAHEQAKPRHNVPTFGTPQGVLWPPMGNPWHPPRHPRTSRCTAWAGHHTH